MFFGMTAVCDFGISLSLLNPSVPPGNVAVLYCFEPGRVVKNRIRQDDSILTGWRESL